MTRILIVRFGAMGDILHTMPAVSRLRRAWPEAQIAWVLDPRWMPLLSGCGLANHLLPLDRRSPMSVWIALRWLRNWRPEIAIDFQGLIKSAVTSALSGASRRIGFDAESLREREAGVFYSQTVSSTASHVVLRNMDLVSSLGIGALPELPLGPKGFPEGVLPQEDFVLAAPYAGWKSKQWPIERYVEIGKRLREKRGLRLVLNVMPGAALPESEFVIRHESGMEGLIDATRRARAVLGLDSGPLHLAALLGKPGLALFGPTDPARNGPHGGTVRVVRVAGAETTYKRGLEISESMQQLDVERVWTSLDEVIA
jgi:heptosyltransferase I